MKNYLKLRFKNYLALFIITSIFIMIVILLNYKKMSIIHDNIFLNIFLLYVIFEVGLLLSFMILDRININKKIIQFLNKEGVQLCIQILWGLILLGFLSFQFINIYLGYFLSGICSGIAFNILKKGNRL